MPPHVRRGGARGRSNTPRHAAQARADLSAGRSAPRTQGKFAAFNEFCKRLRVKLISGEIETAYPKERFERRNVAVSIENRSYRDLVNCTLYVTKVSGFNDDHHQFPRLIQEFSIQSGDTIVIPILSRTLRTAPLQSDKHL